MQPEPTEDEMRAAWARMAEARTGRAAPIGVVERPVPYEQAMQDRILAKIIHAAALAHRRPVSSTPAPATSSQSLPPVRAGNPRPARITALAANDRKRAAAGDLDDEQDETE